MSSSPSSSGSSSCGSGSFDTSYTSSFESYYSEMSIVSSTPSKRGVTGLSSHLIREVRPRLKEDVKAKYSCNVPILDFATHVWGIDRDIGVHILQQKWELPSEPLTAYGSAESEPAMYKPFAEIADSLVKAAKEVVSDFQNHRGKDLLPSVAETSIFFWHGMGTKVLKSPYTDRKPDMLAIDKDVVEVTPAWSLVRQVIEFKRKSTEGPDFSTTPSSNSSSFPPSVSIGGSSAAGSSSSLRLRQGLSDVASASGTKRNGTPRANNDMPKRKSRSKGTSAPATPTASSGNHSFAGGPSSASSLKRKRGGIQDRRDSKRLRAVQEAPDITAAHLQLAIYTLEGLDASTRHYATGLFIDRLLVSLWYYDRSCVISTVEFNFHNNPAELALVLYALSACDDKHAGFDPCLVSVPPAARPTRPKKMKKNEPWQDVVGSEIHLPKSNAYPGRGKFRIQATLFAYRGLIGRGTMVYKVAPLIDEVETCGSEALKISWPLLTRLLEANTIERLNERLPERWREHIPEVTYSATQTAEELNLPRVELLKTNPIDKFEDRRMHALVMRLYGKLWEVGSIEAFQEVFVDCIECHYHAYVDAQVLHRDLSENNLMFKQGEGDAVKGILNDWDMASYVEANNEIELSTATHRTGTIPFMARDLLTDDKPPAHLYRHDLESFYYILVWAALHYDFARKKRLPTVSAVEGWDAPTFKAARNDKNAFISLKRERNNVFGLVPPEREAFLSWLTSLGVLFHKGFIALEQDGDSLGWDNDTLGGHITFHNFMAALGRTPR